MAKGKRKRFRRYKVYLFHVLDFWLKGPKSLKRLFVDDLFLLNGAPVSLLFWAFGIKTITRGHIFAVCAIDTLERTFSPNRFDAAFEVGDGASTLVGTLANGFGLCNFISQDVPVFFDSSTEGATVLKPVEALGCVFKDGAIHGWWHSKKVPLN